MDDLTEAQLRTLAEKATKGPWVADGPEVIAPSEFVTHADGSIPSVARAWSHRSAFDGSSLLVSGTENDNAAFIAAANPTTVLALLDELAAVRTQLKDAQETVFGPGGWKDVLTVETILHDRAKADLKKARQNYASLAERQSTGSER